MSSKLSRAFESVRRANDLGVYDPSAFARWKWLLLHNAKRSSPLKNKTPSV